MALISGDQMTWHKITLDFEAPQNFTENPSTFRDYRLDVTFTNDDTGEVITVPGYFAADGDAANSNATSGNIWRANFNPPSEGNWTYQASFRTGTDIAAKTYADAPNAGTAVSFIDGDTGTINVTPTDKTGEDFRAKGMIIQDEGTHYLQHQGDQDYFIRGGPGIPENFLANTDFDNTANGRHDYSTHVDQFNTGDPTWDGGKGKAIIGATNYLAEQGQNTIYILTNTSGGDGQDVSPWTFAAQDTPKFDRGIGNAEKDKFSTYDVSKLTQWEIVFDHLDDKGIYKNILLQETENDQQLDGGTNADGTSLSVERLVYIREMIARFGHNNGIQWNIGEENTNTNQQRADQAEYLKSVDGYDHLVVIHSFPGQVNEVYNPLLDDPDFDGASFQVTAQSIRDRVIEFREKSADAGDPWVLTWDEDSSSNGVVDPYSNNPDSNNEKTLREAFWGTLTAGGSGGNWYFKAAQGQSLDQNYDTFDAHASVWKWTAAATDFFNTHIPFWDMKQADGLTSDNDDFVMAKDGEYYAIYLPYGEAGDVRLNLNGQGGERFDVFWYTPRTGGNLIADGQVNGGGVVQIGGAPSEGGKDWVLLVRNVDAPNFPTLPSGQAPQPPVEPPVDPQPDPDPQPTGDSYYKMDGNRVVIQAEGGSFVNDGNAANGTWELTNQFAGSKGDGVLLWTGNDFFGGANAGTPKTAPIEYDFEVTDPGTYYISLRAIRPNTGEPGDRNNDFFIQFEDEAFKKIFFSGNRETFNWATTYDVNDVKSPATIAVTQAMIDANDGIFTLTISARSRQAGFDEIHIQRGSVSRDDSAPTSELVNGDPTPVDPMPNPDPTPDPDNVAPVAADDTASTGQNQTILVDVLANDTDANGDNLTLTNVSYNGNTSIVSIEDGKIKVNPLSAVQNARTETITYTVRDENGATDTATLAVNVGGNTPTPPTPPTPPAPPANEAPVAADDAASTPQNKTIVVDVLANDSDAGGGNLTLTDVSYDGNTSIVSIENGKIKVNPLNAAKNDRTEVITYTVTDEDGETDTATLRVNIGNPSTPTPPQPPANTAPEASDDADRTNENTGLLIDVLANDNDVDGDTLTISAVGNPANGMATIQNGQVLYTPNNGFSGADTFTYTVSDGNGGTSTGSVAVTVDPEPTPPANQGPVAQDDTASTAQNKTIVVDVLANDSDADGGDLTLTEVSYNGNTSLVSIENGQIKVNPLSGATNDRVETISYTVSDADGATDTATLSVEISGGDSPTPPPPTPGPTPAPTGPITIADAREAGLTNKVVDYLYNQIGNQQGDAVTQSDAFQNTVKALRQTDSAPSDAILITDTSRASINAIENGAGKTILIQGDLNFGQTLNVASNTTIYVDGSITMNGSHKPKFFDDENTGNDVDAVFRVDDAQNVRLIGLNNAELVGNYRSTGVYMEGSSNVEVRGFEVRDVWEGIVAHWGNEDITVTNNYVHDTGKRGLWSLGSDRVEFAHNLVENAGADGIDLDAYVNDNVAFENVFVGWYRWAGFVEEGAQNSQIVSNVGVMADFGYKHPEPQTVPPSFTMGFADNGTTGGINRQTANNYFIDNDMWRPDVYTKSSSGGDYFAQRNAGDKGTTYFWGNGGNVGYAKDGGRDFADSAENRRDLWHNAELELGLNNQAKQVIAELDKKFAVEVSTQPDPMPEPDPDPQPAPDPDPAPNPDPVPDPEPQPAPDPEFNLEIAVIDAQTDQPIGTVGDGGTITLDDLGTGLNFAATADGVTVGSMTFSLDSGKVQVENVAPYAAFGNNGNDFNAQTLAPGNHALEVKVFTGKGGTGALLGEETITFTVAEAAPVVEEPPVPEALLDFFIADAGSDETLRALNDGDQIEADVLGTMATFYATTDAADVDYVRIMFEGNTSVERVVPYALFGDSNGDFRNGLDLDPGNYTLTAAAFDANSNLLEDININFELV